LKPINTRLAGRTKISWEKGIKEKLIIIKLIIGQNVSRVGLNGGK
jgi:hypothetical protein